MVSINTKNWKEFKIGEIFEFKRGKRLIKNIQINGDINYISSTKNNNGIDNEILPPNFMKIYKNKLTLSNSGSVGYCFYQKYKFVSSDHCTIIWIKNKNIELNKYIGLFLKPIFEKIRIKYNFGREINNKRLKNEWIKLPVNKENKPDFEFMEKYIKSISKKVDYNRNLKFEKTNLLNNVKFKEFKINKIFNLYRGKRNKSIDRIKGDLHYYSASKSNNGLTDMISNPLFTDENKIIFTTFGDAFFVKEKFTASDEVTILKIKEKKLNKFIGMFLISILKKLKWKYDFGRKAFENKFKNEYIKLPVDEENNPDFEFMENYIKSLPYSKYI